MLYRNRTLAIGRAIMLCVIIIGAHVESTDFAVTLEAAANESSSTLGYKCRAENSPSHSKWVQIDLGKTESIDEIRLFPAQRPNDNDAGYGFPPRFCVEVSNDPRFKNAELLVDLTAGDFSSEHDKPFQVIVNKQSGRYLRITAKKLSPGDGDYVFALSEVQVFSEGRNVAYHAKVSALDSFEAESWSKRFLVDGFSSRVRLSNVLTEPERAQPPQ